MATFGNPVLSGFNPDPSVCAAGGDYYLATSTFAYFPAVPIYHSRDLANWTQIGNILDRQEQVRLEGVRHSQGIFAPTLRHHDGIFYMITTNVSYGGNFIVTATDPAGPWSEPHFLENAPGIDPSLFFDEDGRCFYTGTRENPAGAAYNGDWEVWLQELDIHAMKLIGIPAKIWKGAMNGVIWPEGPHLYKRGGYYYLMIAEGGTGFQHAITIARSKRIDGPYRGNPCNPILTHRHLGRAYPVQNVGHGDLVETPCGKWYMTCLASRPYQGHCNLGRETFLAEVFWEDDWPVVNPGRGILLPEQEHQLPLCPAELKTRYSFEGKLDHAFLSLRTPQPDFYQLRDKRLVLKLLPETLSDLATPAYIGLRQKSMRYSLETKLCFSPEKGEEAGLAIVQHPDFHLRFVLNENGLEVICTKNKEAVVAGQVPLSESSVYLKITGKEQELDFSYSLDGNVYSEIAKGVDARFLSTEAAGGFVGCTFGMYASANGKESGNHAEFERLDHHWEI